MNSAEKQNLIIYTTKGGKASVALYAQDGNVWLNRNQLAELFAASVPNISMHISNIFKDNELDETLVVKDFLTTALDGRNYPCGATEYGADVMGRNCC